MACQFASKCILQSCSSLEYYEYTSFTFMGRRRSESSLSASHNAARSTHVSDSPQYIQNKAVA